MRFFNSFFSFYKEKLLQILHQPALEQKNLWTYLLEKYVFHFFLILIALFVSLGSHTKSFFWKEKESPMSLDQLVPEGFVLVPIEISNGEDLFPFVGNYGVVDLYLDSQGIGLPTKQIASQIRIFPPQTEEGFWTALIREKEVIDLFEYSSAFYAVIQNPKMKAAKIYKKLKKSSLVVIEESF
ncbi:MAG: hypothetical protein GDA46_01095 [Bdellovibrionales bacterium]|nr:hypothetical protein [Bdellovibrionales bacterium]